MHKSILYLLWLFYLFIFFYCACYKLKKKVLSVHDKLLIALKKRFFHILKLFTDFTPQWRRAYLCDRLIPALSCFKTSDYRKSS